MPTGPDTAVRGRPATVTDSTQDARHRARSGLPHGRWNTPGMNTITKPAWTLRPAEAADLEAITELRALVMRPDLERLGRYDEHRVRQRLRDIFAPEHTSVVLADGEFAGCVTMRPVENGWWVENFYLSPALHGQGIGSAVLRTLLERADADGADVRLDVLQGSAARRLYERHGFTLEHEDPIDVYLVRRSGV